MDRGAWWAIVHRIAKSWTQLSDFHFLPSSFPLFLNISYFWKLLLKYIFQFIFWLFIASKHEIKRN